MNGEFTDGTNILGLVVFSVVLAIALAIMDEAGKPLVGFFSVFSEAMMKITTWVVW